MQIILGLLLVALVSVAVFSAYQLGYVRGFRFGIVGQNVLYGSAYKQVLSISTEENKKRLDDAAAAQERIIEAARRTNNEAIAAHFEGKPQA